MKKFLVLAAALFCFGAAAAQTSNNEIITVYNGALESIQAKNFVKAAPALDSVIDKGATSDDQTVLTCVLNAKKYIVVCYLNMGGGAAKAGQYDKAIELFSTAATRAELYGDNVSKNKANTRLAAVYMMKGGESFNNKDYKTAVEVFEKGYEANPRNTAMALNLAMSYCELDEYEKGMNLYNNILALPANPRYEADQAKAKQMKALYTNNKIAKMQQANDYDGIIAMAGRMAESDPALAAKIEIQAYANKKDYAKVIELGETAAAAQIDAEDKSDIYFILGAAYNAKEQKAQAIEALKKVTAGANAPTAAKTIEELSKAK